MKDFTFDKIKESDIAKIELLQECCFAEYLYRVYGGDKSKFAPLTDLFTSATFQIYKIVSNSTIVAAAIIQQIDFCTCKIYRMFVSPEYQKKGIGSFIIANVIERFKDCVNFILETPQVLEGNLKFYKKNKFEIIGNKNKNGVNFVEFYRKVCRNAVTGLKPSDGGLHLGHYVGNIFPLIQYQDIAKCHFVFADWQILNINNKYSDDEVIKNNIFLMLKQMLALGVDISKVDFFIESKFKSENFNVFIRLSDFISDSRIHRLPLIKSLDESNNQTVKMSLMIFPILQALDVILTNSEMVFSNTDNKPYVELINEVVVKISNIDTSKKYKTAKLVHGVVPFLEGIDGEKMSKAKNNCIFFTDKDEIIAAKVRKMYTDPTRIHGNSKGNIEKNVVFKYLKVFASNDEYSKLCFLYENGEITDAETKSILTEKIILLFTSFRAKFANIDDSLLMKFVEKIIK